MYLILVTQGPRLSFVLNIMRQGLLSQNPMVSVNSPKIFTPLPKIEENIINLMQI